MTPTGEERQETPQRLLEIVANLLVAGKDSAHLDCWLE